MSFFSSKNKIKDGFHVVVEILDSSIVFSVLVVKGKNYGELATLSLKHRLLPANDLPSAEVNKISALLAEGFAFLAKEVKTKSRKKNKIKIESAAVILFPPWFVLEKRENILIGKPGQINSVSKKMVEEVLLDTRKDSVIEAFVENITLNGYKVSNPIDKKGKDIRASASLYAVPGALFRCLEKDVGFHTGIKPTIMTSPKACALFCLTHLLKPPVLLLDVESETTCLYSILAGFSFDVSAVQPPIYFVQSTDLGLNQIIKNIMHKSDSEVEVAGSYLRLLDEDLLSDNASVLIKSACDETLQNWKLKVNSAMAQIILPFDFSKYKKFILSRDPKFGGMFRKTLNQGLLEPDLFESGVSIKQVVFESSLIGV